MTQVGVPQRRGESFLLFLADHNPFYLLSAVSMLAACVLLSNSTTYSPISRGRLLGLIATLGVYELLLVALGLFLIARRGIARDGVMILVVEAFFLADIGFLDSELCQQSLWLGIAVNACLLVIAVAKIGGVFWVLKMPLMSTAFAVSVLSAAALLGHPAIFKHLSDHHGGFIAPGAIYAAWWVVGMLIAAYGVAIRMTPSVNFTGARAGVVSAGLGHVFIGVLLASLVAHLGTAHWVYKCAFDSADLSPIFAALALVAASVPMTVLRGPAERRSLCLLLLVVTVMTSAEPERTLTFSIGTQHVTPIVFASAAAYLVFAYAFALRYFGRLAVAGASVMTIYVLGPSMETLAAAGDRLLRWMYDRLAAVVPQTRAAWGVIAATSAFVLLGAGAAVSILHRKAQREPVLVAAPQTSSTGQAG